MEMLTRGVFLTLWLVLSFSVQAHTPSQDLATKGFTWLAAQQTSSGDLRASQDLASPLQGTHEAVLSLANSEQLSRVNLTRLAAFLDQQTLLNTEHRAKLLAMQLKLGWAIGDLDSQLLAAQNPDGGFGNNPGYDSTVYDTVYALQALALTRHKNSPVTGRAIGYLLKQQQNDRGFGIDSGAPSSLYVTSLVLRALQPYLYTFNVGQAMTEARDYLLAYTEPGSSWPSDWEAAQFLLAVVPLTTDVNLYKGSLNWLRAQQLENGSWQNDVFSTALALQALHLSENISFPTAPDTATIKGRVLDEASGQPLVGVTVTLAPASGTAIQTDASGYFQITGLQPSTYSLTYSAAGYLTATQQLQSKAGQLIELGVIALRIAPTTALLSGSVTEASGSTPIANALVEAISGGNSLQVLTGLDGVYSLAVPAGTVSLRVSAEGYQAIAASANVAAGGAVKFSPSLYKNSEQPAPLELIGRVVGAEGEGALSGVTVTHLGSGQTEQTNTNGEFTFADLSAGEQRFSIALAGYQGVTMALVLPANGRVDVGAIQLTKEEQQESTRVYGRIVDADTGLGVPGATVAVDGLATITDAEGHYSVSGVTALEFTVGANATGYSYASTSVTLGQHRALQLNLELLRADVAGIGVDAVATDKADYAAYERVDFQATLSNKTVRERRVRLYVLISDRQGKVIDRFPAVNVPMPDENSSPEAQAHYEQHLEDALEVLAPNETRMVAIDMGWNTGRQVPGQYRVTVQALEGSSSQLVAEAAQLFGINPTQRLASVMLEASPAFALMDSDPEISIKANLRNSSNEQTQASLNYVLRTPSGAILQQGNAVVDLEPEETTKEVVLDTLQHTFIESGTYPLEVSVSHGTTPDALLGGAVYVPPTVRLTVEQDLTPEQVIPGSARKVQIQIQVKGVDGE